jgi:hypothetical protein
MAWDMVKKDLPMLELEVRTILRGMAEDEGAV